MKTNLRQDRILQVADDLGGAITLSCVYAMFPSVTKDALRRTLAALVERGAFVRVWCADLAGRAFLTTYGVGEHASGLRFWIHDQTRVQLALQTGDAGASVKLPSHFVHNQMAALVAAGVGGGAFETERSLWLQRGNATWVADAAAWPTRDLRVLVEIERMIGQSPHRWALRGGAADRINASLRSSSEHPAWHDECLVVSPKVYPKHPDMEAELAALVAERVAREHHLRRGAGWWWLSLDHLDGDPMWHPVVPGTPPPVRLLGIHSQRALHASEHAAARTLDAERKAAAAARRAERAGDGDACSATSPVA